MTHIIIVSEDTTLGEEHSGMTIVVDAEATITLPNTSTYAFIEDDDFMILSDTASDVDIVCESGVTTVGLSSATLSAKGSAVKVKYHHDNEYIIWGSLCIALVAGITALVYNNTISPEAAILINWVK